MVWNFANTSSPYTNASSILREDFQDTDELDGLFSGFDAEGRHYDQESWQYEGIATPTRRIRDLETKHGEQVGCRGADSAKGRSTDRSDAAASALRLPGAEAPLRPLHAGDGRAGLRHSDGDVPQGGGGDHPQLRAVSARRRSAMRSAGPTSPRACRSSGPRRSCSCCWAIWAVPAAGSWRLRGHASIQGSTDISTLFNNLPGYIAGAACGRSPGRSMTSSQDNAAATGFWGNMRSYTVSLLKAWWGDAATEANDYCFDYIPKITGDHGNYQSVMDMIDGKVQGLLPLGRESRRRFGKWPHAAQGSGEPGMAGRPRQRDDRFGVVLEGRPGGHRGGMEDRRHRHRGLLHAGRHVRRKGRHASPIPSGCCNGTTKPSSRRAIAAAICISPTTSAGIIRERRGGVD